MSTPGEPMSQVGYLAGDQWLISGPRSLVLLSGDPADALRWWPAVRAGADATELIGLLYTDGVLGTDRPVTVVCREDDAVRVLVQAGAAASVRTAPAAAAVAADAATDDTATDDTAIDDTATDTDGAGAGAGAGAEVVVDSAGLLSWREQLVPDAALVRLGSQLPPDAAPPLPDELLPMPTGVVRAGQVCWQLRQLVPSQPASGPDTGTDADARVDEPEAGTGDVSAQAPAAAANAEAEAAQAEAEASTAEAEPTAEPAAESAESAEPAAEASASPAESEAERTGSIPVELPAPAAAALAALAGRRPEPQADPDATQDLPSEHEESQHTESQHTESQHTESQPGESQPGEFRNGESRHGAADQHPIPPAPNTRAPDMSRSNPFPSLSVPQFAPPPFVPISTTLPPAGPAAAPDPAGAADLAPAPEGDHDGHTQLGYSQLGPEVMGSNGAAGNPDITADFDAVELGAGEVYAVLCASRHANPPLSSTCRICGAAISDAQPQPVTRPVLADLALSTGQRVPVQAPVVIGRAPAAVGSGGAAAQLVTVPSPHQDISRSHVEVRAEDWHVVVADLKSTNGTVVRAPDRPEQLLHPGQAIVVEPGWEIDLGDGVTVQVREPGDQRDMR